MHRCHKHTIKEFKKSRPDPIKGIFSATVNHFTYRIPDLSPIHPAERTFIPISTTIFAVSWQNWFAIIWLSQSDFLFKGKELLDRDADDDDDDDDGDDGDGDDGDDGDGDDGDDGDVCMMWMSVPLIGR